MGFPVVSIRDFVNVQKALLESLGIHRLAAVAGPSGGAVQAVEWAAAYPNMVERVIAVVSPGLEIDAYGIAAFDAWNTPILMDPNWLGGDYYGHEEPVNGVARALGLVTLGASGHGELERQYGRKWAPDGNSPAAALDNRFAVEEALKQDGIERATTVDANHFLYMSKAQQLFAVLDIDRIAATFLFVPVSSDLLFPPALAHCRDKHSPRAR